jgi:hypothetical protein
MPEFPGNLWLFLHTPKTAGSSLSAEIARVTQQYRNIHVDYKTPTVISDFLLSDNEQRKQRSTIKLARERNYGIE